MMTRTAFLVVVLSGVLPLVLDCKVTNESARQKRQAPIGILNPPIPTSIAHYLGGSQKVDNCPRDEVQLGGGCHQLLTQGPCSATQYILLDPKTNEGYCAERLCAPDRIFIFSDQLCHDPRNTQLCPPGRQLYQTSYGTPICQCPDGTYEGDDDLDDDVCDPILGQTLSCPPGQVFWFRDFSLPPECLPDPCGGVNLNRGPNDQPFVPSEVDGKCYQLGQRPGVCPADTWYSLALGRLRGVCSSLEDAGYQVFSPETLAIINEIYGPPIPRESTAAIPVTTPTGQSGVSGTSGLTAAGQPTLGSAGPGTVGVGGQGATGFGNQGTFGLGGQGTTGVGGQSSIASGQGIAGTGGQRPVSFGNQGVTGTSSIRPSSFVGQGVSGFSNVQGTAGLGSQRPVSFGNQGVTGTSNQGSSSFGSQGTSGFSNIQGTTGFGGQGTTGFGGQGSSSFGGQQSSGFRDPGTSGSGTFGASGSGAHGTSLGIQGISPAGGTAGQGASSIGGSLTGSTGSQGTGGFSGQRVQHGSQGIVRPSSFGGQGSPGIGSISAPPSSQHSIRPSTGPSFISGSSPVSGTFRPSQGFGIQGPHSSSQISGTQGSFGISPSQGSQRPFQPSLGTSHGLSQSDLQGVLQGNAQGFSARPPPIFITGSQQDQSFAPGQVHSASPFFSDQSVEVFSMYGDTSSAIGFGGQSVELHGRTIPADQMSMAGYMSTSGQGQTSMVEQVPSSSNTNVRRAKLIAGVTVTGDPVQEKSIISKLQAPPDHELHDFFREVRSLVSHSTNQGTSRGASQSYAHSRRRRSPLPHAAPGNVIETRLVGCRAGAERDINAKCRDTILPSRAPASRATRAVPPVPARPGCPSGQAYNLQRMCESTSDAVNSINAFNLG